MVVFCFSFPIGPASGVVGLPYVTGATNMLAEMAIPEVVDLSQGVHAVIVALGGVAFVAVGGALALLAIRRGLKWVHHSDGEWDGVALSYEEQRIRQGMEAAALDGDWERYGQWGDRYEAVWGEEARAQVEEQLNQEHKLWMQ